MKFQIPKCWQLISMGKRSFNTAEYLSGVIRELLKHGDHDRASRQKKYLRNQFDFIGLSAPLRKEIIRPFLHKSNLPPKKILPDIVEKLWQMPEREFQHFAMELVQRYHRVFEKNDMPVFEQMITQKSWWDTVDYIASNSLGTYFLLYPDDREIYLEKWLDSGNIWLQRSALLFQLKYRDRVDTHLLGKAINSLLGSKEFFINKAIGWSLRQYAKYNADWVVDFVGKTPLENLSRREAMKNIG